jgi:hypothetical protein
VRCYIPVVSRLLSLQEFKTCRGLIGPTRQFGKGGLYHPQLYALIVGAFLPLPFWLWQRRYPGSWIRFVSTPILMNGVAAIPPATGINYSSFLVVGFIFQYVIRKRNFAWWSKFNYVTSAALDSGACRSYQFFFPELIILMCNAPGTVISLLLIFFALDVSTFHEKTRSSV